MENVTEATQAAAAPYRILVRDHYESARTYGVFEGNILVATLRCWVREGKENPQWSGCLREGENLINGFDLDTLSLATSAAAVRDLLLARQILLLLD